jgi:hypothetical protein
MASETFNASRRLRLGLAGASCGLGSAWFLWNAQQANPIIGFVFGDLGVLFGSCSLLLFIGAIFLPAWLPRALTWVDRKLNLGLALVLLLPVGFLVFVLVVCPILFVLKWLGVW